MRYDLYMMSIAEVVELADTRSLGVRSDRSEGSSPSFRIEIFLVILILTYGYSYPYFLSLTVVN